MNKHSSLDIGTLPYWLDSASFPTFAKIDRDVEVDVVVVGGGITGLTTAYMLTSAGKSVALIERGRCAEIDTAHTTAHLTMVTDTRLHELVGRFGRSHAQAVWDAGRAAIDQMGRIVDEHGIDCSFDGVEGYLHAPAGEPDAEQVDSLKEDANLARELGFGAEFVDDVPLMGGPGVRFADQARVHPRKYLAGLARAIRAKGGEIFEHSPADEFLADPLRVEANGRRLRCKDIVIATHNPIAGVVSTTRGCGTARRVSRRRGEPDGSGACDPCAGAADSRGGRSRNAPGAFAAHLREPCRPAPPAARPGRRPQSIAQRAGCVGGH